VRPEVVARIGSAVDDLDTTIRDIRSAIFELRAPMSSQLRTEVRALVDATIQPLGFRLELELSGPIDSSATADVRDDILGVLREALSNVIRHAEPSEAYVSLVSHGGRLTLTVTDNGVGVSDESARSGLANMRERATRHGGTFDIRPGTPRGRLSSGAYPCESRQCCSPSNFVASTAACVLRSNPSLASRLDT
jgi:signal transduction histidine kinase